jgi:dihydropyrimidinase
MRVSLVVRNGLIFTGDGPPFHGSVAVADGRIAAIESGDLGVDADEVIDARDRAVIPGLIDPHVHIGHGDEHARELWSEGCSAIIGGVTTIYTYFRKHPFEYLDSARTLIRDGVGKSPIDFAVLLPMFTRANLDEIDAYASRLGIRGFKFFPGIKGEDAAKMTDLPHTGPMLPIDDAFVLDGLRRVGAVDGAVAFYHAENPDLNAASTARVKAEGRSDLRAWCDSRPDYGEAHSVRDGLWWQRLTGCPIYFVHLSSGVALDAIREERSRRPDARIFVETCPQFLAFDRDADIGVIGKMSPPFRGPDDQAALWEGIADGAVDTIGSDHGAFMRAEKQDAWTARSGFPGLATILPAMVTYGVRAGRISMEDLVRVCSTNAARVLGLYPRKGSLQPGSDADIVVVDAERERVVDAAQLQSRSDFSIFEGRSLTGWPEWVVVGGRVVLRNGALDAPIRSGRYLGGEFAQ